MLEQKKITNIALVERNIKELETKKKQGGSESLEDIHKDGTKDFYNLRKRWSYWIIGWISGLLIFHFLLALAIGFGWVDFSSAPNFLQTILIGDFAEIVGMGFVLVKFFHDEQKEREAKNRYKS